MNAMDKIVDAPNPIDLHVGLRLRELRLQRGMSQQEIAQASGVSFQQVQKYERGTNRISASRLWAFAEVLEVDIREFFAGLKRGQAHTAPAPIMEWAITSQGMRWITLGRRLDDLEREAVAAVIRLIERRI